MRDTTSWSVTRLGQAGPSYRDGRASVKLSHASRWTGESQTERHLYRMKCSICLSCGGRWSGRSRTVRLPSRCTPACFLRKATGCRLRAKLCSRP